MQELVHKKMYLFKLHIILFLLVFHANHCQRRVVGGEALSKEKKYVVYLLKASSDVQRYEDWLCGGALVSSEFIVTSAACVTDVQHLYAIAGYNKYISETDIHTDLCTKEKKKKIVFTCVPKDYHLDYHRVEKWSFIDIAMVKVESPYDFGDASYATHCSYTPAAISINYESKYQEPGIDAIVLGWGHKTKFREDLDFRNFNEDLLQYGPVLIEKKEECKKGYAIYRGMDNVIDRYMICTMYKGNLNDEGATIVKPEPTAQGCDVANRRLNSNLTECEKTDDKAPVDKVDNTRKNMMPTNLTVNDDERKLRNLTNSRRAIASDTSVGICQNDHGGPLVTWIGAHEVLIGVASAYKLTEKLECIGPYLYTSTQCNGAFLDCVLRSTKPERDPIRRAICENFVNETGYDLFEQHISWKDHPDGPADNERNITTHASVKNTTNNVTLNLKNSKEEGNNTDQVQNTTKLVTNTNNTTPTLSTENPTFSRTTKADNLGDNIPINLTKTNTTKSATVMSSSDNSVALENETITNKTSIVQPTNYSTTKSRNIISKKYMFKDSGGRITTVLMQRDTNLTSTTTTKIKSTTTEKPGLITTVKVNVTTTVVAVRTTKRTHVKSTTSNTTDLDLAKSMRTIKGINEGLYKNSSQYLP